MLPLMGMGMTMSLSMGGMSMDMDHEPPTPSVESTASSVFETAHAAAGPGARRDVEMSDASSFTSEDEGGDGAAGGKRGYEEEEEDVEMDDSTPTMTARPVEGRGGRGWVPWGIC